MDWNIDDESPMQTTRAELDIVPPGVHRMEIIFAEEGTSPYRTSDSNPDGHCLKLRLKHTEGDYRFVFHDIPKDRPSVAKQLAEALGCAAFGKKVTLQAGELLGQFVGVEVEHYTAKSTGKVSAIVKRYVKAKPQAAPAKRTATQKADAAASGGTDDIPFLWIIGVVASALSQVIA